MGDAAPPRKRRLWLLLPAVGLAVFLAACSAGWLYARLRIDAALDAHADALRHAGWTVALDDRRWSGFPFRLKLSQVQARIIAPSGWGLEVPGLEAEAVIFDPAHWVFAAPRGLVLDRGVAGPLQVQGRSLSASASGMAGAVWRIAVVGEGLSLAPGAGARPTAFARIERWEAYLRPAADGSGDAEALWRLTGGAPTPHQLVWNFSPGAPVAASVSGRFTRLQALSGSGWAARVRAWGAAGGAFQLQQLEAHGGPTRVWARGGALSVDPDGRLAGALPLEIRQAVIAVGAGAPQPGPAGEALVAADRQEGRGSTQLVFADGQTRLGGLRLGPAPKIG